MFSYRIPVILATLVAFGCSEHAVAPTASGGPTLQAGRVGRVTHLVTVGSPDACFAFGASPGCDANFSLVALQGASGVTGQWSDRASQANGGGGLHITVTCLVVDGNKAWVGGVGPEHTYGTEWVTRVVDNGKKASDPADQISYSFAVGSTPDFLGYQILGCPSQQDLPLLDAPQGQAVVVQ